MIPNFNPNEWNKEKILDYVIGDQPLTDQQLEFLIYFKKLQDENNAFNEFEKWLEEEIKQKQNSLQFYEGREPGEIIKLDKEIPILKVCLNKLVELKGTCKNEQNKINK